MSSPAIRLLFVALGALALLERASMVPVERLAYVNDGATSAEPTDEELAAARNRNRAMLVVDAASGQQLAMATSRAHDRCGQGGGAGPCPNKDKMCAVICKNNPSEGGKVCNCDTYALRSNQPSLPDCNRLPHGMAAAGWLSMCK